MILLLLCKNTGSHKKKIYMKDNLRLWTTKEIARVRTMRTRHKKTEEGAHMQKAQTCRKPRPAGSWGRTWPSLFLGSNLCWPKRSTTVPFPCPWLHVLCHPTSSSELHFPAFSWNSWPVVYTPHRENKSLSEISHVTFSLPYKAQFK